MNQRARSSELTGGEGYSYEDIVCVVYLCALLREEAGPGQLGRVTCVAVQQHSKGEPLDDLIVDAELDGLTRRLSLQVKREIKISAAASNKDFRDLIANARATRAKPDFRVGVDRYGFIARKVGAERLESLKRLISWAQASATGADFAARFVVGGEAGQRERAIRDTLSMLILPKDADDERDFYHHFVALKMDGLEVDEPAFTSMANRLAELVDGGEGRGVALATILARLVRVGQGDAKVWSRAVLLADLRGIATLRAAPAYAQDLKTLADLAQSYLGEIRADIGGIAIPRESFVDAAEASAARFKFSNISGLPGCGKSVVLRRAVERAAARGPVLFIKGDRIEAASWPAFAATIGLKHRSAREILTEIGASGTAILFIDGVDRIKPSCRGVVTDLLTVIATTPELAHWSVLASSRDQGLEPFRQWVPAPFYKSTGIGDVAVGLLNDAECEDLAEARPHLRRLLFGADSVREIARRPFFAAVLSDQFAGADDGETAPQTEIELIAAWWRAGGYNAGLDVVLARQRAMLDLADAGACSLGKAIAVSKLKDATIAQAGDLKRDYIVEMVEEGSVLSFAHDIFFEWTFFRLLVDRGDAWRDALVAAGEPPLLGRVVGLLSQHVFERDGAWAAEFTALDDAPLRPQWRRAWLLAPPASASFNNHLDTFEQLLFAKNGAWLNKFLVWFQAERTIPNRWLLANPAATLSGAALVRMADAVGWPSDFALWRRVLVWIFAREQHFPPIALVHAVELFAVFQNALADHANPISERLIALAETWLMELEKEPVLRRGAPPPPKDRWSALPEGTRGPFIRALRQLLLRSARAYPNPARRIIERAIALERRSEDVFETIVDFSTILAQTCPRLLADLVRAEVLEKLPLAELEDERVSREAHYAQLKAIREKPEAERTSIERRILSSPASFSMSGRKTFNQDDMGIDRHHRYFYPPTPAHQPFASLFAVAPDIARALVRDMANHATTAWRQVLEINARNMAKPLPLDVTFPWGVQRFWGDAHTYLWYLGAWAPQPLEAAFTALTLWAHKRLDAGDDPDEVIRLVLEGHDNWAALGLGASLALESMRVSETTFALVTCQRLWHIEISRMSTDPGRPITVFGMNPQSQMTAEQVTAQNYLLGRKFRNRSIRDLTRRFVFSRNEDLAGRFKAALQRFPDELPFAYEEDVTDTACVARYTENAKLWSRWGDRDNYKVAPAANQPGYVAITYEASEPPSQKLEEARAENTKALFDFKIAHWATESLRHGTLDPSFALCDVLSFARGRDKPGLFDLLSDPGAGATQGAVAAAAAVAAVFATDNDDIEWAWTTLARTMAMQERDGAFLHSNHPLDPRLFLIGAIFYSSRASRVRPDFNVWLLTLASDENPNIAQNAFQALMRLKDDPHRTWVAFAMATELFCVHAAELAGEGKRDFATQNIRRLNARVRAIARLNEPGLAPLAPPPPAWVHAPPARRSWDDTPPRPVWRRPDFDFDARAAGAASKDFPMDDWLADGERRTAFLAYLDQLVAWTNERLFPVWRDPQERRSSSTDLYEWQTALTRMVAHASTVLPAADTLVRFVTPIAGRGSDEDAQKFASQFADALVCVGVYDAETVTADTLTLLRYCAERMLEEGVFDPDGWRAGKLHGWDLPVMVKALLFVSVSGANGARRFANDDWTDIAAIMDVLDLVMAKAGWSAFVMDNYLTVCERADAAMPIAAFGAHVLHNIEMQEARPLMWSGTMLAARIAGVVQRLAEANFPLAENEARDLLGILDRLVDMGDRRAAALQQSENFRGVKAG